MVTSGKRFILNQDKKNSAVTQLTDNVTKPISIPSSLQQEKEIPAGVQKIIQNQPGTPNGSISAPDKSNTQIRLEYQKQQMSDKARDIKESVVSNAKSLGDSFVSELSKAEEKVGSEVAAAAATKFTMNAAEVEEAVRREAGLLEVENRQAQEGKPRVESEFSRMLGDTSKLQEPFNLKLGFSPSPFKTGYLNFLGDEVSLTNGTSSITKPVIKTIDYKSVLGQAYDTITYKAANEQEIMTVESFDELFPEYKDVPYDQKQIFINECLYDVQQGKKRDINEFADFFGSMSMKEGYVNQQDATIQYLTDSDVAKYSLNAFIGGTEALEGRTPEQIRDYIEAAYTIKAYADEINKQGYNVTDSAGWTIVKSFADDFEDLNQAIKTFESFNLTNTEAYQINNLYEKNLRTQNELINDFVYGNEIEQHNALKQFEDQYLQQFHKDYISSFIREVTWDYQKDMEKYGSSDWNELMMWLYQDDYELDGKYYNKDGEEILPSEGRDGFLNRVAEGFIGLASEVETLGFDTAMAQKAWKEGDAKRERTMDVLFDTVNVAFSGMMEFTGGGQLFQFATTLGRAGAQLDWLFSKTMEGLGTIAEGLADMIGFTDGWSKDSKEKYKQAMEGIGIVLLGRLKNHMVKKGKTELLKYLDDTAMMKALKAYVAQTAEGLEVRDGGKVKEVIKNKGKTEEKKGEPKTRKEVEERAKEEKKTEEIKTEDTTQRGKITMKQGTQENALRSFREIFDNEIEKINTSGESPKLVDSLFQAASSLVDRLFIREKETPKTTETPEIASDVPVEGKTETATPETVEIKTTLEQETIETTPEAPGIVVEEASTTRPEEIEGTAEVREPDNVKETKTTVAKILDIIQKLQDNAKGLYDKLTKPREMSEDKKIRQREIERQERTDELLNRMGDEGKLDKGTLDNLEDNRATDEIMRIVDRQTDVETDTKGRPKNVTPKKDEKYERDLSKDDVEREVLSSGLTRMQQYVDNIKTLLKKIGEVYDKLSKEKNINSMEFIEGDILRNLLDKFNLRLDIEENKNGERNAKVRRKDNVDTTAVEDGIIKYVEDFINKTLRFEMKSEADVQADRTKLSWNEDTYGKYDDGFENEFRKAFNDFLDTKADQTELLRKLDQQFSNLKDNLEILDDFMNKKGELKNSAKNKILKLGKEDLAQLEQILPGITKLVELTRISYDLVSKVKKAKMQYRDSNLLRGHWVRYMAVMAASNVAGFIAAGWLGIPLASLAFVALERGGTAAKRKVSPKELDRSTYNKYVDLLKVEGNEKAEYKQGEIERIKKESEILKGKKEAEVQQTLNDAMEILIKRKANELIQQKAREAERERRVKDKEETQKGYSEAENKIIETSLGLEEKEYSKDSEELANVIEESVDATSRIMKKDAINKLEEKGEDVTPENIAKEVQKEPSSIEEFIIEAEKGAPEETTNYDGADIKDLEEVVANPEKYPNVDIEAAKAALEKARRQNQQAEIMQSPDQQQAQKEIAGIYKGNQMEREGNKEREKQREDMVRETNRDFDTLETTEEYDRIESQITPEKGEQAKKYAKGYKGFYRSDKAKTDTLRADMGKKPSQNITRTSSVDQIATLDNPKSRARVAQEKLNKRKRLSEEEKTQLTQIIEQANVEIQAKEELKAQKTELANEYKALEKKRSETPYRETKKEITKQMDKISEEFDKIEMEEWEAEREISKMEYEENMEIEKDVSEIENETPQTTEVEIEDKKEIDRKERELEAKTVSTIRKSSIDEGIQEAIDKGVAEEKKEMTELIKSGKIDKGKKYEMVVERKYNKFGDTVERGDIKPIEIDLENAPDALFELAKYVEKGNNISLKYWNGNNKNIIRSTQGRGETTNIEGFKKRYENNKTLSEETNKQGKETKTDKLSKEERKQLNQINKEIEDSLFYKGGTDARGEMTDREKIEFTNTLSPYKEFYHASDSNIKEFDLDKTKDDPNGIGLSVSTKSDNAYKDKKHQYTIDGKGLLIAKEGTTISEEKIKQISEKLGIEPNEMWQYVPLAELSSFIKSESGKSNKEVIETMRDVTKYDGVETSHDYVLLWNMDKVNPRTKKNKGGDKPEEPTTPKKPEPTKPQSPKGNMMANVKLSEEYGERKNGEASRPGDGPLLFVENDGTIRSTDKPGLGEIPTYKIQTRIEFLKQKRADNGKKLYAKELSELKFLQDLLKRQIERENREQGTEATEADLDRRENLAPGMGGIQQSGKGESED